LCMTVRHKHVYTVYRKYCFRVNADRHYDHAECQKSCALFLTYIEPITVLNYEVRPKNKRE